MGSELFTGVTGFFHWISEPNISDVFSWLKPFDLQGLKRNMDKDLGNALEIVSGFIRERLEQKQGKQQEDGGKQRNDLLDLLLEFEGKGDDEPEKLSQHTISVFCLELFFASADTVSSTIEWSLAELLHTPEKLVRVKDEMDMIVGRNRRDTECWNDSLSFKHERFLGSNIDYKGQDFELIPFGAGRRMCAHRLLHLIIGSLLHELDWERKDSTTIDMTEKTRSTIWKLESLKIIYQ
ncbi:hypothetical protein LIER_31644 [Lithospermum erythrorhizon]|uniref:Cytochrome P450 n=1 Tax=Lithospermum erythrorhizon TaxID=34254 RepID=A0AAV3RRK6_LITER